MNNEIKESLNKVKKDLLNEPVVQEYLRLKELILESDELSKLKKRISFLQKCHPSEEEKDEYYKLLNEYNNNPLIIQFKSVSDDVCNLLEEVKKELEIWLFV